MRILKTILFVILILIAIPLGLLTFLNLLKVIVVTIRTSDAYNIGYAIGTLTANLLLLIIVIYGIIKTRPKKETTKKTSYAVVIISLIAAFVLFIWVIGSFANRKGNPITTPSSIPAYEYKASSSINTAFPEYVSIKHGFKVRFPTNPTENNYGKTVHYFSAIEGEGSYNVFAGFHGARISSEQDLQSFFKGILQGRMNELSSANLIRSRQVIFLGCRGIEYEHSGAVEGNKLYFQGIDFIDGDKVYLVSVVCPEESKTSAYPKFDDFVRSFSLLK